MSRLGTQSEINKLGTTLGVDPSQLDFLVDVPPEDLRSFRTSIYERLFEQDAVLFQRLAIAGARLPAAAVARLAEGFGPMITARVAAEMPPEPALAIAEKVSVEFFADACEYLDPRRTRDLIARIPLGMVVEVALEMARRGKFMTVSRFVDFVTDEQTQAVVDAIDDEAAILRVAFYMGSKNRMDHLFRTLSRDRLERMILRVEAEREELLPAFLSVLIHVSYGLKRELGDIIAAQEDRVLEGYVRAAHEQELWSDVLPVVAGMSPAATYKVVNLPILREREVQRRILVAAQQHGLWGLVLPLVELMDDSNRGAVASIIASMNKRTLEHACEAALMGEHWAIVLDLVRRMHADKHGQLAAIVETFGEVDPELVERIAVRAQELGIGYFTSESRSGARASTAYS